ncbi:hypothetical protein ACFYY1_38795 [Streptomyces sp. NPDC001890]|uniref:hypothetical protein n=1 Tax=Streptomyces sp. NPDC001890 TaxID=3364620 RepID=UPI0036A2DDE1
MSEQTSRSVNLSQSEFTRLYFLTRELTEFPAERLQGFGCDAEALEDLLSRLRSARRQSKEHGEAHRLTLVFSTTLPESDAAPALAHDGDNHTRTTPAHMTVTVPASVAQWWAPAARWVLHAHSPREISLRTGYSTDELREALATLPD